MTAVFKDHFSGHAAAYAQSRPLYPPALFDWLASQCVSRDLAIDVGCGNGQASLELGHHFGHVRAFDPSTTQIASARPDPRVQYAVAPAEHLPVPDACADLLLVAQALHWFDFPRFFAEVQRVLKPSGRFCAVHYQLLKVAPWIDRQIEQFELQTVGDYWPPERRHIDNAFCELTFPFPRQTTPTFTMRQQWTLAQVLDYVRTWSAVQRYQQARGVDPVPDLGEDIARMWGDPEQPREITWPLLVWFSAGPSNADPP